MTSDPYVVGRQLGSEGRDKIVYEGRRGESGRWVALAQFRTQSSKVRPELRRRGHAKSTAKIRVEAEFQRRAAERGLAPALIEVDLERSRLIMEPLPGGTLFDLARSQRGSLTVAQQRRLVDLLKRLGSDAGLLHNDCGNPANFLADASGQLFVIDFGMAKDLGAAQHVYANLYAIRHLLFDVQQGLITHGALKQTPELLVSEYEAFLTAPPSAIPCAEPLLSAKTAPRAPAARQEVQRAVPSTQRRTRSSGLPVDEGGADDGGGGDGVGGEDGGDGGEIAAARAAAFRPCRADEGAATPVARCPSARAIVAALALAALGGAVALGAAVVYGPSGADGRSLAMPEGLLEPVWTYCSWRVCDGRRYSAPHR